MKHCFVVELGSASAEDVLAAVDNVPGCLIGAVRSPVSSTLIILFVETDLDEDAAFDAIAKALPVGATLHKTFAANKPTLANKPKI